MTYQRCDVIPDIHADIDRLEATLDALGDDVPLAFLGDFIDAGKTTRRSDDAAVLERVRGIVDAGRGVAVMGNHELNAILYHTLGVDQVALRKHTGKNQAQHRSFVRQFGTATPQARDWTDWFLTLPLWQELVGLRLVHACWSQPDIDLIAARRPDGRLRPDDLEEVAGEKTDFAVAVKNLVTGPELRLPQGYAFEDAGGDLRHVVRIAWWRSGAATWRDAALSVPDPRDLPTGAVPQSREVDFYPRDAPPVLVGHYKMADTPGIEAPNAACLDYPASLCTYRWRGEDVLRDAHLLHQPWAP